VDADKAPAGPYTDHTALQTGNHNSSSSLILAGHLLFLTSNQDCRNAKGCMHVHYVRSFLRGGVRPLAVFRRAFSLPPALRPMRPRLVVKLSLGIAQCASPLTLRLVLYIYRSQLGRRVSLAGANMRSSYIRPLAVAICCPHWRLSPQPDILSPGVMACHSLKRTQANPLYGEPSVPAGEFNLVACRNLTRHAGSGGR